MIVKLSEQHLSSLQDIENSCFPEPLNGSQLQKMLSAPRNSNFGFVSPQLQGFAIFSTLFDEAELLQIAVSPEFQNRGVAHALLQAAMAELASQGIKRILLEVRASNLAALSLYKKLGFLEEGVRKGYYPATKTDGSREDAVLMGHQTEV